MKTLTLGHRTGMVIMVNKARQLKITGCGWINIINELLVENDRKNKKI